MSQSLTLKKLSATLAIKSLADFARAKNEENVFLVLDCSSSMDQNMRNGKRRIEGLREVVSEVQKQRLTKMVSFRGMQIEMSVSVPEPSGGTPLFAAISFCKVAGAGRLLCISDGEPDSEQRSLDAAREFGGRIDVVFVGDPGTRGEAFMKELAEATGGTSWTGDLSEVKEISSGILGLLTDGADEDEDSE